MEEKRTVIMAFEPYEVNRILSGKQIALFIAEGDLMKTPESGDIIGIYETGRHSGIGMSSVGRRMVVGEATIGEIFYPEYGKSMRSDADTQDISRNRTVERSKMMKAICKTWCEQTGKVYDPDLCNTKEFTDYIREIGGSPSNKVYDETYMLLNVIGYERPVNIKDFKESVNGRRLSSHI